MRVEKVSDTVNKLFLDNNDEIILVGTAHVSQNSVEEVTNVIDTECPDHVCLELDKGRFDSKTKEQSYANMDLVKVFKEGKAFLVLANTALASFQKKMGYQTGSAPGEEILSAGRIAKERNIPFSLCDREIQITFKRAWSMSNLWNKAKLIGALISSAFDKEEFKPEELEELKKSDTLQELMNELSKELPGAKKALIDERDRYLATSILCAPGHKKVAVIGAGHANGIIKTIELLEKKELSTDLSDISQAPKPSKVSSIIGWTIPIIIVASVVIAGFFKGFDQGLKYFLIWACTNSLSTVLFSILSNAHPLNWIVAAIGAPLAVLNPALGVGLFTGIAEAKLRKPRVKDFEQVADDIATFKGWFSNRVLHAFLIFFTTSLGSIIGTFVLTPIMLKIFG
ncbi:MAG: TraB/GumN family protein [Sphaerochaetaceae bacterium]|nr:TraB/GumN family protein [Sphaerochaetaceae bacterium]